MLPKLKAAGHRILIFTQMTAVMSILEDYMSYRSYACLRLDGSTPAEEREKRMYMFNAPDSPYFVFLLSTRAGGLGLNLATADTVIIFDSDWNPMMDLQAQDRAHRIGQRNEVRVFRLVTYSPVEEKILSRANEKLNMSEIVVGAGKFDRGIAGEEGEEAGADDELERRKMMEVLLTDFDTEKNGEKEESESQSQGDTDEVEKEDPERDLEEFNEMLSGNEADYEIFFKIDEERRERKEDCGLFVDEKSIPDWIRYPPKKGQAQNKSNSNVSSLPASDAAATLTTPSSRRRNGKRSVIYDDGLTEFQFVQMVEKTADAEENAARVRKVQTSSRPSSSPPSSPQEQQISSRSSRKRKRSSSSSSNHQQRQPVTSEHSSASSYPPDTMLPVTDNMNRKLINICKSLIALREPLTKRRISEIFLEKPCRKTYPDYYQIIKKPIGMNDILKNCRSKFYSSVDQFYSDWLLLFANARQYNADGSWVVVDAGTLETELLRAMEKNGLDDVFEPLQSSSSSKPLRIKLSLKSDSSTDSRASATTRTARRKKKKKCRKKSIATKTAPPTEEETTSDGSLSDVSLSQDEDATNDIDYGKEDVYSDVVGMDQRERVSATGKKRGKIRSGGRGSRGGVGSRGTYKKSKSKKTM